MKHTTKSLHTQLRPCHLLVVLSLLGLALLGRPADSQAGWLTCPPRLKRRAGLCFSSRVRNLGRYVAHSWPQPCLRSLLLIALWMHTGRRGPMVLCGWPWLLWAWQAARAFWPELEGEPAWRGGGWVLWQGQRLLVMGFLAMAVSQAWELDSRQPAWPTAGKWLPLTLGCQVCGHDESGVEVTRLADGGYQATLCGHFSLRVDGDDPFRARLLLLFLRLLDGPSPRQGSRRTRDGRTPFVRQAQVSGWFGLPQPDVSRIEDYWRRGAWPELLSQCTPELLTPEVVERIAKTCATFPHWTQEQVYEYLHTQGLAVSQRQVRQAMDQSGWSTLRRELCRRYDWTATTLRLREEWLVQELLRQVHHLVECLETGRPLPAEEQLAIADGQQLATDAGIEATPPAKAVPWLSRLEQLVFGDWQAVDDQTLRCPHCGSTNVGRKSRTPRPKKFYDAEGQLQTIPVYRYYCRNSACSVKSFTHLPPGLIPYSRQRLEVHVLAVQAYAWSYSTYRRVGQALNVSQLSIYRWVSAWGYDLLPVAALFGVVRSSGVVGVDEKYVLVPKNDKPAGKMRRWMYVYLAVDVYTYDLLHIAVYAHNTSESAQTFLLALLAKGYRPRVVVTDLRRDYGPVIAQVFPKARHHECLFHAEQEISRYLRKTWGTHYAEQQPHVEELRTAIVKMLQARTKRTAQKRYHRLLAKRQDYLDQAPALDWVFDFLEQHWPCLVNTIESELIPTTNNAVEMVIRRFDRHYQNFCGFESIETAKVYLGVFERIYRFTPFSNDAQPAIRGKSPLQLAGYDVSRMPMPWLCRGYSIKWPVTAGEPDVPNP